MTRRRVFMFAVFMGGLSGLALAYRAITHRDPLVTDPDGARYEYVNGWIVER